MNRTLALLLGVLVCVTGSGCYHFCHHNRYDGGWNGGCPEHGCQDGCNHDSGKLFKGTRLQHHRPRSRDEVVDDDFAICDDCGRRHRRGRDNSGLCDDCSRQVRRERRSTPRNRRDRRGRQCDACGGACTGECGNECSPSCGGCNSCGGDSGFPIEGGMMPMQGGDQIPYSSGGCSGCSGGGSVSGPMSSMGTNYYPGTVIQGGVVHSGVVNGPMIEGQGNWYPASMPNHHISEPVGAPSAGNDVYSSAPSPGTFPTPAR